MLCLIIAQADIHGIVLFEGTMFMPNFMYSFQADIDVIVLYEGSMFLQALLSSL